MDSLNITDDHWLISVEAYWMYIIFISVLFVTVPSFENLPRNKSSTFSLVTGVLLFLINFFALWFAPGDDCMCNPMAFYLVFFPTMVAAPGLLIYHLECVHYQGSSGSKGVFILDRHKCNELFVFAQEMFDVLSKN